jgi:TPR repeat protein
LRSFATVRYVLFRIADAAEDTGKFDLARQSFERGAALGSIECMFGWFQRAADTGDGSAQLNIAKCYLNGIGVRTDVSAGLRCLAIAIQSNCISEVEREEAVSLRSTFAPRPV